LFGVGGIRKKCAKNILLLNLGVSGLKQLVIMGVNGCFKTYQEQLVITGVNGCISSMPRTVGYYGC